MGLISHHIMPPVVHSLAGRDTHTQTHTHTCKDIIQTFADRSNSKKPGTPTTGQYMLGLKSLPTRV